VDSTYTGIHPELQPRGGARYLPTMPELKYPLSLIIRAVDGVTKPLESINSRLEKTGSRLSAPFARLGNRLGALGKAAGIPAIAESFGKVSSAAGNLGEKALGLGAMFGGLAAAGGVAFVGLVRSAEEAGSRLNDMSAKTGLSVNAFAQLEFAAKRAGVGGEEFAGGMEKLNKGISEARRDTGPLAELLKKVGPAYLRQLKGVKSNEEAFNLLAAAMQKIQDPGKRAELATAAFGRSGVGMVNVLKDGPAGVAALRAEFLKLAGDQSGFAANSDALGDSFDNLETALLGVRNTAAGALMPALTRLTDIVTGFVAKNRDGIQQWAERTGAAIQKWIDGGGVDRLMTGLSDLKDTVVTVVDKVGGLGNALGLVAMAMAGPTLIAAGQFALSLARLGKDVVLLAVRLGGVLVKALASAALGLLEFNFAPLIAGLSGAIASTWAFTAALLANPIAWIVAGIALLAGAAYLIYKNWGPLKDWFSGLWDGLKNAVGSALAWVGEHLSWTPLGMIVNNWGPIKAFFSGLWDSITGIFKNAWGAISPYVDKVMSVAQFIPGFGGATAIVNGARSMFGGGGGAVPALGAAQALPPPVAGGTAAVRVDFVNAPRGTRATSAGDAPLDLNLGITMAPGT